MSSLTGKIILKPSQLFLKFNLFILTALTNPGMGILSLTGDRNEKIRINNMTEQFTNPVSKKPLNVRQVITFTANNILLIENNNPNERESERKSIHHKLRGAG